MDNVTAELLQKFQPLCVGIAKEPSIENITALHDYVLLCKRAGTDLNMLLEYIIFPLQITIKRRNVTTELKLRAINCIRVLLSDIVLKSFDMFREVFQNVCLLLSSKEVGKVSGISEDAKEELLNCLLTLLESPSQVVLKELYGKKFMPSLGHCISLLLSISEKEKAKQLIVKATKCIKCFADPFLQESNREIMCSYKQQNIISCTLASFLPGISISLCKVVMGGIQQGQNVIIGALEAWLSHIKVVMNDQYLPKPDASDSPEQIVGLMSKLTTQGQVKQVEVEKTQTKCNDNLLVQKDITWYHNTSLKLKILIEKLPDLSGNSNWKVHLALLQFSETLLKTCSKTLGNCMPCLFEIVVGFSINDYLQVSGKSKSVMNELQMVLENNSDTSFVQVIEKSLYSYFTSFPREIRSTGETNKLRILHVIVGYLHVLGSHLTNVLNSGHFLKRVSYALIQVLEFDLTDKKIVEEKAPSNIKEELMHEATKDLDRLWRCSPTSRKIFKHFRDEKIVDAVCQICGYLGRSGQLVLIVDHLLDIFRSSPASRKQVVFLVNEIIRGTTKKSSLNIQEHRHYLQSCITLIMTEYLSPNAWNAQISNKEDRLTPDSRKDDVFMVKDSKAIDNFVPFSELNSNVQLSCMLLEGIAIFATTLSNYFEDMLLDVLYPVMEKLGSSNAIVSQTAYFCLVIISVSCSYSSLEDLIKKNVDYLINSISLNLRHIRLHPDTPAVFNAMVQCGNADLLPYLEDCLEEVLDRIDYATDEFLWSLSKALNSIVVAINRWYPFKIQVDDPGNAGKACEKPNTELREFFVNLLKLKQSSLGEVDDADIAVEQSCSKTAEQECATKEIPLHIKFAERVLEKCAHFMTSRFVQIRLIMLDTTEQGVVALASEENHLLPMIHKFWQPIVQCLSDYELVVRIRTVSLLCTMVNISGQFMRRRIIKDAFPLLTSFLVKQQVVSIKTVPLYHHTQSFKLQLVILNALGQLCSRLDICDVDLDHVLSSILPYLSERHPSQLQQAAVSSVKKIIDLEPDFIWMALNDLYCPENPSLPSVFSTEIFPVVDFACGDCDMNSYAENVKVLLDYCAP